MDGTLALICKRVIAYDGRYSYPNLQEVGAKYGGRGLVITYEVIMDRALERICLKEPCMGKNLS